MALSKRGQEWAKLGPDMLIWQVIQDLWDPKTNPHGYVSLGVAENGLMHEELSDYIHSNIHMPLTGLTYGDGGNGSKKLRQAMAGFLNKKLRPVIQMQPSHICVTNGVTTGIEHLSSILGDQGDVFLLGQPHYGSFLHDICLRTGLEVVKVAFDDTDPLSTEAVSAYEAAINHCHAKNQRVAGIMLCNPHNPLGRCYSRAFIIKLMRLCQQHKIHLVSDEIYALSVFRTSGGPDEHIEPFTSLASIPTDGLIDPSLTHILYGLSKDFGANGIRLGAIISQHNPQLHNALIPVAINSYASSLTEAFATKLFSDDAFTDWYIAENQRRLKASYETVVAWADKHKIEYAKGVNAAFFLWVNLGKIHNSRGAQQLQPKPTHQSEQSFQELVPAPAPGSASSDNSLNQIVNEALLSEKVFLASGTSFGSERPGWFRIVFSQKEENLLEGLRRIERALGLQVSGSKTNGVEWNETNSRVKL
ncbi:hypothetical protein H2198_010531 [Neophaeococcomyces mojaviensis]|uniref:Uncharacterized protein n=1 Tax=Neophaeococcomyces mojaviensis TaxID=3383035 RepID=A0ACC2ZRL0_9EURO|nr:hypothetical protein H2198_010531 [Knufia sp. JES_112]